jgi:hypothetical protein
MERFDGYRSVSRTSAVYGYFATAALLVFMFFIGYWGVALLDPLNAGSACKYAQSSHARSSGILRLLLCEMPKPVPTLILLGTAIICFWGTWRALVCLVINRPKFLFDDKGGAALLIRPTLISGLNWHDFSWGDIESIEERTQSRNKLIFLRFSCLGNQLPTKKREYVIASWDARSDYFLTFFHLLSRKRPDFAEQVDRLVRLALKGKERSAKFVELFPTPAALAPPPPQ